MKEFPRGGLVGKTVHLVRTIAELNVPLYAANAGYFIILSLFPALVLMLSLLRHSGLQLSSFLELTGTIVPGPLMEALGGIMVQTYEKAPGALVGVSAAAAIWSASRGVYGLLTGLNAIYGVSEDRGFVYTRLISLVYTFILFGVLFLTLTIHVFGSAILKLQPVAQLPFVGLLAGILDLRFFLLLGIQSFVFALMFTFLPNGRNKFRDTIPGAILASLGWLIFSDLFSVYVEHFASLSSIYGSVYAVALGMLWLYCCMSILFYGGALNQYREDHRAGK